MSTNIERRLERTELDQTIFINNVITGDSFGELVNVTVEGLMIMTNAEIPSHSIFQFSLQLPMNIEEHDSIELGADCLWSCKADNFNHYWSGFHIIDASDNALKQLQTLINHCSK